MIKFFRIILWILALEIAGGIANAQIQVELSIPRSSFIAYEPLLVTVSLTNLTGNPLTLRDSNGVHWFGFEIETLDGRPIAPLNSAYENPPVVLEPAQKLTRTVNITPLFPISEYGGYRIRASIYAETLRRSFTSTASLVEISEGRTIQKKTVGVPDELQGGGSIRVITLMSHRLPSGLNLYLRIENASGSVIYCTHKLGRILSFAPPDLLLDRKNSIHILQNTAPKSFLYSHIGLNGEIIVRKPYAQSQRRPILRELPDGSIEVVGASEIDPSKEAEKKSPPSLSDRPIPVPGASTDETPSDEKRPKNLLSQ